MDKKDERIKKNLVSSLIYQVVLISISFLLPRLYIENFGSEVNGFLNTIKQIFTYMCLLEAGVGLATTQALYKKVRDNNHESISAVLAATHKYYIRTGVIYSLIVLVIACVYSFIIPTGIDSTTVFLLVILTAIPSMFGYFVQAKYKILMEVDGRKYIINSSETIVQILANTAKLIVIFISNNLVHLQLAYCIISLMQYVFIYVYAKRKYKWLDLKVKPDVSAISQKDSVLVHQLSGIVFNNTDVLLLSAFADWTAVSIYGIYNIFFSQVQNFITNFISGFNFFMGQLFQSDREEFMKFFNVYETLYIMATFIIYTLMAVFLLPIVQIYTSGITDANYSNIYLVFLFAIMNLLANGKLPSNNVLEYSGSFEKTRSHAIWEMVINIVVSIVGIIYLGICGALIGTIAALIYRSIMMIYYSNRKVLSRSQFETYKYWLVNGAVFTLVMAIFFVDSFAEASFVSLLLSGITHSVWIVLLFVVANLVFFKDAFKTGIEMLKESKNL